MPEPIRPSAETEHLAEATAVAVGEPAAGPASEPSSEPAMASTALAEPRQEIREVPEPGKAALKEKSIDAKIAEFYGARQTGDVITFVTLYPRAQSVQVAGDFNGWQPDKGQLQKVSENGIWQLKLPMASGRYRYRLVVDGVWQQDPYNEVTELNPFGEFNSVVEVH